jgi:hypothetical protein
MVTINERVSEMLKMQKLNVKKQPFWLHEH